MDDVTVGMYRGFYLYPRFTMKWQKRGTTAPKGEVAAATLVEAFAIPDIIRTATNLVPPEVKEVRIIDIVGLDQQADGGTHVATTSQIGRIEVVKIENKGKGFRRLRIRVSD